jgi:hypothetical protein
VAARAWLLAAITFVAVTARADDAEDDVPPPPPPNYNETIPPAPGAAATPSPGAGTSTGAPDTNATTPEATPPAATSAGPDAPETSGNRVHDGLHLRGAVGFGGVTDKLTYTPAMTTVEFDGTAGGGSLALHLGIGGAVSGGLLLGGFLLTESVTDPEVEFEGVTLPPTVDVGTLGMLGVFVDYYPSARGGFHFGGGLGAATLRTTQSSSVGPEDPEQPGGGGAMGMVGYDWWIGDAWAMGVLGRITVAGLRGGNIQHDLGALAALFTIVYD